MNRPINRSTEADPKSDENCVAGYYPPDDKSRKWMKVDTEGQCVGVMVFDGIDWVECDGWIPIKIERHRN